MNQSSKMTKEEYISLYEKYLSGTSSPEELKLLEGYKDEFELLNLGWDELLGEKEVVKGLIYSRIRKNIRDSAGFGIRNLMKLSAAAAILLIISTGLYFYINRVNPDTLAIKNPRFKNDIPAGKNTAVLTLDNGSEILLDDAEKGLLAHQGSSEVEKDDMGQLVYRTGGNKSHTSSAKLIYNTVSTPSGGQYQIILPDGTKVWLNAASSLRFPTAFRSAERRVELSGEAYFEVSKNAHKPFRVQVKDMEIKVLGTHFNVMAYQDENKVNTTLLEGAVEVHKGARQQFLKPGQQATLLKSTGSMRVDNVNVEEAVAWKNGYFVFNNEDIQSIMRKISRWYNVEVNFEGNMNNKDFVGMISRSENVSGILNMLELTDVVHFKVEGRRITVMP